jgi:hypothetical protein
MNTRLFTGYLPAAADEAWAPAQLGRPNEPRLVFDVIIKDSQGNEFPEKCFVDNLTLVKTAKPLLTAGRAIIAQGEQTARPFIKHGITSGWMREVRVTALEFPNRARSKEETAKTPKEETEEAA